MLRRRAPWRHAVGAGASALILAAIGAGWLALPMTGSRLDDVIGVSFILFAAAGLLSSFLTSPGRGRARPRRIRPVSWDPRKASAAARGRPARLARALPKPYPLIGEDRIRRLEATLAALERGGVLEAREFPRDAVLPLAGEDDEAFLEGETDFDALAPLLARCVEAPTLRNARVFEGEARMEAADIFHLVVALAQLAGRSASLSRMQVEGIAGGPIVESPDSPRPDLDARLTLELDGRSQVVPFTYYRKHLPAVLVPALAPALLGVDQPRRLAWAWSDGVVIVSVLTEPQIAEINAALAGDARWLRLGRTGRHVAPADRGFFEVARE